MDQQTLERVMRSVVRDTARALGKEVPQEIEDAAVKAAMFSARMGGKRSALAAIDYHLRPILAPQTLTKH